MENLKQQLLEEYDNSYNDEYLTERLGESPRKILSEIKFKDTDTYFDALEKLQKKFYDDFMFDVDMNTLELFDTIKHVIKTKLNDKTK